MLKYFLFSLLKSEIAKMICIQPIPFNCQLCWLQTAGILCICAGATIHSPITQSGVWRRLSPPADVAPAGGRRGNISITLLMSLPIIST